MPWLILTDRAHAVQSEGLSLSELDAATAQAADLSSARAADEPNEVGELLAFLAGALRGVKQPAAGKGSAVLTLQDSDGLHRHDMDFQFQGTLSRTDQFALHEGARGERQAAWTIGREASAWFNRRAAVVQAEPTGVVFFGTFGYDYRPAVVCDFEWLADRVALPGQTSTSIESDESGLLTITRLWEGTRDSGWRTIVIDKNKGYRPVFYEDHSFSPSMELNPTRVERCRWSWERYGQTWYVKEASLERPGSLGTADRSSFSDYRAEFVVERFDPNVVADDSEFTLESLDLPEEVAVTDLIRGVTYRR